MTHSNSSSLTNLIWICESNISASLFLLQRHSDPKIRNILWGEWKVPGLPHLLMLNLLYSHHVHRCINCYHGPLLSYKESGTLMTSHFTWLTASSLLRLIITLWWEGNSQQCNHSHVGLDRHADCSTSTFTASDSPDDLKVGFKLSENWKRGAFVSYSLKGWGFLWTRFDWTKSVSMPLFVCVYTVCVILNRVMYWLWSWFYLVLTVVVGQSESLWFRGHRFFFRFIL